MAEVVFANSQEGSSVLRFHWAWVILAICFVNFFLNYSISLGFGIVLPEMIQSLGLSRTQGGIIYNFYLIAYICLTPLAGNLTDRFGARRVITLLCIALGIGTLFMGAVESFWMACMAFALVGAGASGIWTPVLTMVQRWFSSKRKGMALGILSTGYGLGFATMGLLFPVLVESLSWRFCWYVLGIWTLIMVLVNGIFLRSGPEDLQMFPWGEEAKPPSRGLVSGDPLKGGRYGEVFRLSRFWSIGTSFFFISSSLFITTTFVVDYANLELGFSFKEASFLATAHGLSQVAGVLTIPILSDRIGRRLTIMGSNVFIALSVLGIISSGKSPFGLYTNVAILGAFYGATWPMYGACAGDYFSKEVMGTVIGTWTSFCGLGGILAHLLAGRIRDITQSFQMAFYIAIIFALVSSLLMLKVKTSSQGLVGLEDSRSDMGV
jgi:MFS family permease